MCADGCDSGVTRSGGENAGRGLEGGLMQASEASETWQQWMVSESGNTTAGKSRIGQWEIV